MGQDDRHEKCFAKAIDLIKKWEGFRPIAYPDHGRWSVGYGTKSFEGEIINEQIADERLRRYVRPYFERIRRASGRGIGISCGQLIALTSLAQNLGFSRFSTSSVWRDYLAGNFESARSGILSYRRASGVVQPGLEARRKEEYEYWDY